MNYMEVASLCQDQLKRRTKRLGSTVCRHTGHSCLVAHHSETHSQHSTCPHGVTVGTSRASLHDRACMYSLNPLNYTLCMVTRLNSHSEHEDKMMDAANRKYHEYVENMLMPTENVKNADREIKMLIET